jgi:hypothetical protein
MYFMFSIAGLKRYFMPIASSSQSKSNTPEETGNVMPNQVSLSVRFWVLLIFEHVAIAIVLSDYAYHHINY